MHLPPPCGRPGAPAAAGRAVRADGGGAVSAVGAARVWLCGKGGGSGLEGRGEKGAGLLLLKEQIDYIMLYIFSPQPT